ncbi:MAG: hypothetical protein MUC48_25470 [Leptolyngbya sp. Prado105]|jgi:hypothetical protein|nr:hypothetical protein [Leptolyngbya sp. Prado105]
MKTNSSYSQTRDVNLFRSHSSSRYSWRTKGAIGLSLFLTLLVSACETPERQAAVPGAGNVQTEDVVNNTAQLVGQTVTVRSEPIQKISPYTFTIADQQFFGSEPILVVNATGQVFEFPPDGTDVQVTGEVRQFVLVDLEREYGFDLQDDLYVQYADRPALIAQSMAPAPEPGTITEEPTQFYNRRLAVTGQVSDVVAANAFTLNDEELFGGQDLLVLYPSPDKLVEQDQTFAVTGQLRQFVAADINREYELGWEPGVIEELEVTFADRPVLIADTLYPSAIPE